MTNRLIEVGDLLVKHHHDKMQGFKQEFSGPYTIMEALPGNTYM